MFCTCELVKYAGTRFLAAQTVLSDDDSKRGLRNMLPGLALALLPADSEDVATADSNEWLRARKSIRSAYQARITARVFPIVRPYTERYISLHHSSLMCAF